MFAKSDDLRRSLCEIDKLVHMLRTNRFGHAIDLEEIETLEQSRRAIVDLLEARRRLNSWPVISLQGWCDGDLSPLRLTAARLGSIARASHPEPGKPRLHCVS